MRPGFLLRTDASSRRSRDQASSTSAPRSDSTSDQGPAQLNCPQYLDAFRPSLLHPHLLAVSSSSDKFKYAHNIMVLARHSVVVFEDLRRTLEVLCEEDGTCYMPGAHIGDIPITRLWANEVLRAGFSLKIWLEQREEGIPLTPSCTWCGLPTGCWCDQCDLNATDLTTIKHAICSRCEGEGVPVCRPCVNADPRDSPRLFFVLG